MKLLKIEIPKSVLISIPENERIFFVQATNLLNDLIIVRKLMYFSSKGINNKIVKMAQNSQSLLFVRIQAGKLSEGWKLLQREYFGSKVSKKYSVLLDNQAQEALKKIKDYFGKENLIKLIRDEFAFHYSSKSSGKIKEEINNAPDTHIFEILLAPNHSNCLYYISQLLVNYAISKSIRSSGALESISKLLKEINQVTLWFSDFIGECVKIILKEYKNLGIRQSYVEIPDPQKMDSVNLPYFVSK